MGIEIHRKPCLKAPVDVRFLAEAISQADSSTRQASRTTASAWVSISKQLPSQAGDYLVLLRGQRFRVMTYAKSSGSFMPRNMNQAITHWMPLPEPPTEDPF